MVHTFHANEKFEREISKIKSNEKKLFDNDSRKRKDKPVRVQRYYFIEEKRAADDMSRRVISIKKRRAYAIFKKVYLYHGNIS